MEEQKQEFKVGDKVVVKNTTIPIMTIEEIIDDTAKCTWTTKTTVKSKKIKINILEKPKKPLGIYVNTNEGLKPIIPPKK